MTEIDVVVRCRNEMPYARRTLAALAAQTHLRTRVLFLDCGSKDGSREAAAEFGARIHDLRPEDYVPGAVLNLGMQLTRSAVVAFVNADAVPLEPEALRALVEPLRDRGPVAATFARQVARGDADPLTRADYERAFGDGALKVRRGAFFSMAASAMRRDAWAALPFDERIRYSEDCDWTARAGALGWRAQYVADASFEHSHRYTLSEEFRRRAGEGAADASIHRLGGPSPVEDLLRPLAGAVLRDVRSGRAGSRELAVRATQAVGSFWGRRAASRLNGSSCDNSSLNVRPLRAQPATACGDEKLELRIAEELETAALELAEGVPGVLAVALVGSYARGEGGAVLRGGRLAPDNDYDLVAFVAGGARSVQRRLRDACATISDRLGFEVEGWAVGAAEVQRLPATLFWLDARRDGLRLLWGDASLLARMPLLSPRQVPLEECGRLLANRAVGLALSNLEPPVDTRRMARHAHKAVRACGDALLLAADRYQPRQSQRAAQLEALRGAPAVGEELAEAYRDAVAFASRPDLWRPSIDFSDWYAKMRALAGRAHLAFEAWRVATPMQPQAFARWPGRLYPHMPDVRVAAFAAIQAAVAGVAPLWPYLGHPRERLARAAVALAYDHDGQSREPACRLLGLPGASNAALCGGLRALAARAG